MAIRVPSRARLRRYGYVQAGGPACPTLQFPPNQSVADAILPVLTWGAVEGAVSYNVYIWREDEDEQGPFSVTTNSYQTVGLERGVTYRWRATAINEKGESSNCSYGLFGTEQGAVPPRNGYWEFETPTALVSWTDDFYTVSDDEAFATLYAQRDTASGVTSVNYSTADGTAISPTHYTATTGTATWQDGDGANQPALVPIEPLVLVEELTSDILYDWVTGQKDPRNEMNGHQYKYVGVAHPAAPGSSGPWRDTEAEAFADFEADQGVAGLTLSLMGWSHKTNADEYDWNVRPYIGSGPDQDREIVILHYNDSEPTDGHYIQLTAGGLNDTERDCRAVQSVVAINSGDTIWWADRTEWDILPSNNGRDIGIYYRSTSASNTQVSPRGLSNNNCPSSGGSLKWVPDVLIQCRRVPGAPTEIPGSEFPDWEIDPVNFTYDSSTDTLYSKEPWSTVAGSYHWLSTLSAQGNPSLIITEPLPPVLLAADASGTQSFWTAAQVSAANAGGLVGSNYDAQGDGDNTTFPRDMGRAWYRAYKLPLRFTAYLHTPVNAEIVEPDTATVYILPA